MEGKQQHFHMPLLLEPLAERIGHLEHVTQVLQLQFARLQEVVFTQLDERMQTVEDLLKRHGISEESQNLSSRQHQPESAVTPQALHSPVSSASPAVIPRSPPQKEDETGGQRTNSQIHIVVKQQDQPEAVVTVEARWQDRIKDLKSQAYQQLSIWHRFRSLASEDSTEALPPLMDCSLSLVGSNHDEPLEEEKRLADYSLTNEAEVVMLTRAQAAEVLNMRRVQENRYVQREASNDRDHETSQATLVNLLVAHSSGEVNVEARTSETILAVKTRAHQQLEIWCRFTALSGDEADMAGGGLPSIERCRMYSAGNSDGLHLPRLLEEHSILAECGLLDGSKLFLRAA